MISMSRRTFLRSAGATAGAVALVGRVRPARAQVNSPLRAAVIGVHGQGRVHIEKLKRVPGVEVVALCDISEPILNERADALEKETGRKIARYVDLRRLYEDRSIDVVTIATPNHWHSLAAIWAMQAGKDVYVEKPISHNVFEGRQVIHAARRYGRMCQHGVQGRSAPAIREAIQKLHEGVIGKVYMARAVCYRNRESIGRTPDEPVPPGVHYDIWLGPAPQRPFSRNRFLYNWHWFWDYGNGDIGNQGVHEMDLARWGLGVGLPTKIQSDGGKFLFDDDQETPNVQVATFNFESEGKFLSFEVRGRHTNDEGNFTRDNKTNTGVIFFGSEGYMTLRYFDYQTFLGKKREPGPSGRSDSNEFQRFINAVISRKESDLGNTAEDGHLSSALCHLANIAYRLGRTIRFDPARETCIGDDQANAMLTRPYREPYVVPRIDV